MPFTNIDTSTGPATAILRVAFLAGIAVVLTLGATWGAVLLHTIADSASFTAVSVHEVNAHGHAQIFGWVGLFVMGSAYCLFPRFKQTGIPSVGIAYWGLGLMLLGVLLRSSFEPYAPQSPAARLVAAGGSLAELVAIGLFLASMTLVFRRSPEPLTGSDLFLIAALGWFALQAVWDAAYFLVTSAARPREELLALVATWQAPLREIQIYGFAMLMILGVSHRFLPRLRSAAPVSTAKSLAAWAGINLAVLGMVIGTVMMGMAGHAWASLWYASAWLLAVAATVLTFEMGVFRTSGSAGRRILPIQLAYAWLLVSLAMMLLLPAYQFGLLRTLAPGSQASQLGFSHAYYGAIRHAVTVGFITQMIMAMASRVLGIAQGWSPARLGRSPAVFALPFVLLNAGCTLRVVTQVASDIHSVGFAWIAVSGVLEVAALASWGVHIAVKALRTNRAAVAAAEPSRPAEPAISVSSLE